MDEGSMQMRKARGIQIIVERYMGRGISDIRVDIWDERSHRTYRPKRLARITRLIKKYRVEKAPAADVWGWTMFYGWILK